MTRRRTHNRSPPLDRRAWAWLSADADDASWVVFGARDHVHALWAEYGEQATATFAASNPGRRQAAWWTCAAPEMRRRLGGAGVPCHVALNFVEHYEYGVPVSWLQPSDVRYYRGMSGLVADASATELDAFPYQPVDRNDLPLYESQSAFLRRHGLLLPGELKRLTPEDFRPERLHDAIEDALDDWREQLEDVVD